jgi:hypothetical protein
VLGKPIQLSLQTLAKCENYGQKSFISLITGVNVLILSGP